MAKIKYIKNANIVQETGIIWNGALVIIDDRIEKILEDGDVIPDGAEIIDAEGAYVGPGFVDIHVHGGNKYQFTSEPLKAAKFYLEHGSTTVLATFYTDLSKEEFLKSAERVKEAMKTPEGRSIGGFYMEGPYTNSKYGSYAELNQWGGAICEADFKELVASVGNKVRVWAISPERDGIEEFMAYAKGVNPNVVFALAHSEATPSQVKKVKKYGLNIMTHCMDATGRTSAWNGTRGAGPDEACFLDDTMYAEIICDSGGVHVNPDLIRMIVKIKGIDKIILITDGNVGEQDSPEHLRRFEDLSFDANGDLSGSRLTMDKVCKNFMQHTNCGIAQAFLAASTNPARAVGMDDEIGSVECGKKANLVFVDDMFNIKKVMIEGNLI